MVCKNWGIYGFLGTWWVLNTRAPRVCSNYCILYVGPYLSSCRLLQHINAVKLHLVFNLFNSGHVEVPCFPFFLIAGSLK